jgi:hypothetical protein
VGLVGTDFALGPLDPLLNLRQELIDQLRPSSGPAQLDITAAGTSLDVPLHRVVRAAGQFAGITQRPGQVVGIQDFHDLLGRLQVVPPQGDGRFSTPIAPEEGPQPWEPVR